MSSSPSSARWPDAPRGRYAPTPSGLLHLGNARTALVAWASVRSRGGSFVWRVEDLDGPRTVDGAAEAAEEDLAWLGLDWDEGGLVVEKGGPHAPYVQSERLGLYREALRRLAEMDRLFPCRYSRKDLAEIATAPHDSDQERSGPAPYPAHLRPTDLEPGWLERLERLDRLEMEPEDSSSERPAALRCLVISEPVTFQDRVMGEITERVDETVGDFVLARRDGVIAYQLAVVVDDIAMGIDEVVRGRDLLGSTARQIQLIDALGGRRPAYAHVPLVVNADGEKLSKRDEGVTLRSLREAGVTPERLVGYMAWSLGLAEGAEAEMTAREFAERFDEEAWERMGREAHRLPEDVVERLVG